MATVCVLLNLYCVFLQNPPNFLVHSDINNYQTRTVTILEPEEDMIDHSDAVSDIVDLSDTNGSHKYV